MAWANYWLGLARFSVSDYERASVATDAALAIGQAHNLPKVWSEAHDAKGLICQMTGRIPEARREFAAAVEIATRHDLTEFAARLLGNAGNLSYLWDLPGAAAQFDAVIAADRRRGDRYLEGLSVSNLMAVHLLAGRWQEADRIAAEFLDDDDERAGAEFIHYPLAILFALRGDRDAAQARLDRIAAWQRPRPQSYARFTRGDDLRYALRTAALRKPWSRDGACSPPRSTRSASPMMRFAAWPDTLQAAIQSGHLERAHAVLSLLATRPNNESRRICLRISSAVRRSPRPLTAGTTPSRVTCTPRSTAFANSATATGSRSRKRISPRGFRAGDARRGGDAIGGGDRGASGDRCRPSTRSRANRAPRSQRPARWLTKLPGAQSTIVLRQISFPTTRRT